MKTVAPEILDFYDTEVIRRIVEKYGYDERRAGLDYFASKTYRMLSDPQMEMWQFGPGGIFDIWESEKVTGSPLASAYLRMV